MSDVAKWMLTATCPGCEKVGTIRRIQYGMPATDVFETAASERIILGGCMVRADGLDPKHGCIACDWTGTFKNGKPVEREEGWAPTAGLLSDKYGPLGIDLEYLNEHMNGFGEN